MKKLMALGCAVLPLWASESDGASAGVHTQTEIIPSHGLGALSAAAMAASPFSMHDVCGVVTEFLGDLNAVCATSSIFHQAALETAALAYAKAIQAGEPVAPDTMRVLRKAKDDEAKAFVRQTILNALRHPDSKIIRVPKQLPPFLKDYVTDKTAEVQKKIDDMVLYPVVALHSTIAEHMMSGISPYYEDKSQPWSEGTLSSIHTMLENLASQYIFLDDALKPGADLSKFQYVVMPDVDANGTAFSKRKADLNILFAGRPDLTLVVSFADDVVHVGNDFCAQPYNPLRVEPSAFPDSIQKIAFMGKNVKEIGHRFFKNNRHVLSMDMSNLPALESIGSEFGSEAEALTSLTLSNLLALKSIGHDFASGARALTSLTFSNLFALESIGDSFASCAMALTSFTLSNLPALKSIGDNFLVNVDGFRPSMRPYLPAAARINALTFLTLSNLPVLESIGHHFAAGARVLRYLTLMNLPALKFIGSESASEAITLEKLDMRGVNTAVTIEVNFLKNAPATARILVSSPIIGNKVQEVLACPMSVFWDRGPAAVLVKENAGTPPTIVLELSW